MLRRRQQAAERRKKPICIRLCAPVVCRYGVKLLDGANRMKTILAMAIVVIVGIIFVVPQVDLEPTVLRFERMLYAFWIAAILLVLAMITFCGTRKSLMLISRSFFFSASHVCRPATVLLC